MIRQSIAAAALCVLAASSLEAANVAISIGIRETGGTGPNFSDGGVIGGIEWVNLDGQIVPLDGNWHTVSFTPATDTIAAFAGSTADSILDPGIEFAVLEHIRILNTDGITIPIRLWIDDVTVTSASGSDVEGFEGQTVGSEVMFQEPGFSGSTTANVVHPTTAMVTDAMAFSGDLSLQADFQFVDNDNTRWARWTTNATGQIPNPAVRVRDASGGPTTISFAIKGGAIPEPATAVLAGLALASIAVVSRRHRG